MAFNSELSLYKNIQHGLWQTGGLAFAAKELSTTENSIKTAIGNRFMRNSKTPPFHQKVFEYLEQHCEGFREYCKEEGITIAS